LQIKNGELKVLVINPSRTFHGHKDRVMPVVATSGRTASRSWR
jgi:hypothetical protein